MDPYKCELKTDIRSFLHKCRDDPIVLEPASVASEYQVLEKRSLIMMIIVAKIMIIVTIIIIMMRRTGKKGLDDKDFPP